MTTELAHVLSQLCLEQKFKTVSTNHQIKPKTELSHRFAYFFLSIFNLFCFALFLQSILLHPPCRNSPQQHWIWPWIGCKDDQLTGISWLKQFDDMQQCNPSLGICNHLEVVVKLVIGGQPLGQRCSSFRGDVAHLVQENLSFPLFVYFFVILFLCLKKIYLFICLFLNLPCCLSWHWVWGIWAHSGPNKAPWLGSPETFQITQVGNGTERARHVTCHRKC